MPFGSDHATMVEVQPCFSEAPGMKSFIYPLKNVFWGKLKGQLDGQCRGLGVQQPTIKKNKRHILTILG